MLYTYIETCMPIYMFFIIFLYYFEPSFLYVPSLTRIPRVAYEAGSHASLSKLI